MDAITTMLLFSLVLLLLSAAALAAPVAQSSMRYIEWNGQPARWMTQGELDRLHADADASGKWIGWADWTDHLRERKHAAKQLANIPVMPTQQVLVNSMLSSLNYLNLNTTLSHLESYFTRMYNTDTGVDSAVWMGQEFERLVGNSNLSTTVSLYNHAGWPQQSVIAITEGDGSTDEIIIMGAHLDSTSIAVNGRAPGADDDGCGVATIMEMFRLVHLGNWRPKRAIHWMLYAAEEVGLRGSAEIAQQYDQQGFNIYAVYQSEMCGWVGDGEVVIIDDAYTDGDLVDFSRRLVAEYCDVASSTDACNSACSDHASWDRVGARTICTAEAGPSGNLNPNYHRATDLLEYLDTEYAAEFVKYGVGFAIELSLAP